MALRTRLTDALQIEHPVMLAGMGGVSYSALAAAVSEAGGFGCLGASTMSHGQMNDEIAATRASTAKPFGVDLLTAAPQDMAAKVLDIAKGGATAFVAGLGVPREVVDLCHEHGLVAVNMCGKVRHAIAAVEAGCDLVVAQGTEAGGHTGKTCRVLANDDTAAYEDGRRVADRFPAQYLTSVTEGVNHLGGDQATAGVDPDRELFPAGQGVGAIDTLVPAADLVTGMVEGAEAILAKLRG
jgi:NAD(P)H-dependent flavin oxidoreductase YrpB (nitropropane dioxygenase family)